MLFIKGRSHNWRGGQFRAHAKYSYSTVPTLLRNSSGRSQESTEGARGSFSRPRGLCANANGLRTAPTETGVRGVRKGHRQLGQAFTASGVHATVDFRTAILAPGGWASDRAPAYRFDGRPRFERGRNAFASADREAAVLHGYRAVNGNPSPSLS